MDMPRRRPAIDATWFVDQIRERFDSQAAFARRMRSRYGTTMDPSALSRFLRGERGLLAEEAKQMADLLKVPLAEVMRRAGLPAPEAVSEVELAGWIGDDAVAHLESIGEAAIAAPADLPPGALAFVMRAGKGHGHLDGAIVFCAPRAPASEAAVSRLCVVGLEKPAKGEPAAMLAVLRRGLSAGRYSLLPGLCGGLPRVDLAALAWVAPVLYVRP